jgi:hypothetical protein
MSRVEFEKRHLKGDYFIVSALAYGKIIYDMEFFVQFCENHFLLSREMNTGENPLLR